MTAPTSATLARLCLAGAAPPAARASSLGSLGRLFAPRRELERRSAATGAGPRRGRSGRCEGGFVLFLAIFVLLIVTVAGLATMLTTSMDLTLSGNETKVSKVFYAADSGVEYSAAKLRTDVNYIGGQMPIGVSSNYASSGAGDIQVTITRPLLIGQQVRHGDGFLAQGTIYSTPQIVESLYTLSSTASATSIQASKTIKAEIGIYPQVMSIIPQ